VVPCCNQVDARRMTSSRIAPVGVDQVGTRSPAGVSTGPTAEHGGALNQPHPHLIIGGSRPQSPAAHIVGVDFCTDGRTEACGSIATMSLAASQPGSSSRCRSSACRRADTKRSYGCRFTEHQQEHRPTPHRAPSTPKRRSHDNDGRG
jgi:hypothetical protein